MRRFAVTVAALLLATGCGSNEDGKAQNARDTGRESQADKKPQKQKAFRPLRFSGNGAKSLGNLRITTDAVLSWRYTPSVPTGGFIQVYSEAGGHRGDVGGADRDERRVRRELPRRDGHRRRRLVDNDSAPLIASDHRGIEGSARQSLTIREP